jgi:hypothetical protein
MRHPIELAVQQVLPIPAKPAVTADDAASVSRPFALLLAEAEAVHDVVRLSGAAQQGAPAAMLRGAWDMLCARLPWSGVLGLQIPEPASRPRRPRRG